MAEITPFGFTRIDQDNFDEYALELFWYQATHVPIYNEFVRALYKRPKDVKHIRDIPYLPVQFFKSHDVVRKDATIQKTFLSSGTTQSIRSKHHIIDNGVYAWSVKKQFEAQFGDSRNICVLGLLPHYLEQGDSSLVEMVRILHGFSNHEFQGFYLDELEKLSNTIDELERQKMNTLLVGVSYALLDFIEQYPKKLKYTKVLETGGMKGRKREMIREELHEVLKTGFGVDQIYSEYGMTEMLSQAYTAGGNKFYPPSWMRVEVRDPYDPFHIQPTGSGALNIIDLANYHSCAFLEMEDLGKVYEDGSFEVLGRMDHTQIRGCNLLIAE